MKPVGLLRRGALDDKDAAICRAVWQAWAKGGAPTYRSVAAELGVSSSTVYVRVMGNEWHPSPLTSRGWLKAARAQLRTLRPGPRFAGLDAAGWPLECVPVAEGLRSGAVVGRRA